MSNLLRPLSEQLNLHSLSALISLGSALCWAVSVLIFRKCGEHVPPVPFNLFKNLVGFFLFLVTACFAGVPFFQGHSAADFILLLTSGALGMGLADNLFLWALNRNGPARTSISCSIFSPLVLIMSTVFLGEPVTTSFLSSTVLIVAAIVLGNWSSESGSEGWWNRGVAAALASSMVMAVALIIAKPILARENFWWVMVVRLSGGILFLLIQVAASGKLLESARLLRPGRQWPLMILGSVLGTYFSLMLWLAGIKNSATIAGVILGQLSLVFILVFSRIVFGEKLSLRKWAAAGLAVIAGIVVA